MAHRVETPIPALSVHIRDCLAKCWQGGWPKMADAMHALRPEIRKDNRIPIELRKAIFNDLATQDAIDILDAGGMTALRKWLAQRHPKAFAHAAS